MNPILSHQSPKDHYTADACIIWCFDDRFSPLFDAFIQKEKFNHVDLVKVAGGAKDLASPEQETQRAYIIDQIAKSIKLHNTKQIILMMHSECGAYGGLADENFYKNELIKARKATQDNFPQVTINTHFAAFDGLREV